MTTPRRAPCPRGTPRSGPRRRTRTAGSPTGRQRSDEESTYVGDRENAPRGQLAQLARRDTAQVVPVARVRGGRVVLLSDTARVRQAVEHVVRFGPVLVSAVVSAAPNPTHISSLSSRVGAQFLYACFRTGMSARKTYPSSSTASCCDSQPVPAKQASASRRTTFSSQTASPLSLCPLT